MLPVVLMLVALVAGMVKKPENERDFADDQDGAVGVGNIAGPLVGIILTIVVAGVVFGLLATLTPGLLTDFGSFLDAIVTVEIGDSAEANTTEKIIKAFGILFGILFALFLLGLAGGVMGAKLSGGRSSGRRG